MARHYSNSRGQEFARQHIREAEAFSREIGGTDKDVKSYFFNLSHGELDKVLTLYGIKYGADKESYARETFQRWKSGQRRMSGLVAKRIFELLPPIMPLKEKYKLAENVWNHFGPTSSHSYIVGSNSSIQELEKIVTSTLEEYVDEYSVPENIKNRFKWLSAGDIEVQETLLNHFRSQQKKLIVSKLAQEVPVLQKQIIENPDTTLHVKSELTIHKHTISIYVDPSEDDCVKEGVLTPRYSNSNDSGSFSWGWLIFILFIIYVLAAK